MSSKKYTINFCEGPMVSKLVLFTLPIMGSLFLQMTFNLADFIVVGRYASSDALAAVGSVGSLTNLLTLFFYGLSIGSSVVAGNAFGAKDLVMLRNTIRTAMTVAILGGVVIGIVGYTSAPVLLRWMQSPPSILPLSVLYLRICFSGMVFGSVYNFGYALLRALGDTRRPLYYLAFAGVVNVILNLILVIKYQMGVAGVGWATVASQAISAVLVWYALAATPEVDGLPLRQLRINPKILKKIFGIGFPSGLQSLSYSLANIVIQSMINKFGPIAMAGNTAAMSSENVVALTGQSFHSTCITFTSQNIGGKKYRRLRRGIITCCILTAGISLVISVICMIYGRPIMSIFGDSNPEVQDWGMQRIYAIYPFYVFAGFMNAVTGSMRGSGYSTAAFVIVFFCACVFRILWIIFIFPMHRTLPMLLMAFSISWIIIGAIGFIYLHKKLKKLPDSD